VNVTTVFEVFGLSVLSGGAVWLLVKSFVMRGIEEVIKLNFSRHLEVYKSQLTRELEQLKLSLRNTETLFHHQLKALTKLRRIYRHLKPKQSAPNMDWNEICGEIAQSFSTHADELDEFLCNYGAVLPNEVLINLESAIVLASDGKFQLGWDSRERVVFASEEAIKSADLLYKSVKAAVLTL
jgi:hypothetical protein